MKIVWRKLTTSIHSLTLLKQKYTSLIGSLFFVPLRDPQGNTHMHPQGCVPLAARGENFRLSFVVEHNVVNPNSHEFIFVEVELK
jgi:hypothetical protein